MKIAAVTDDGETISEHFGRAYYYAVWTTEEGQLVNKELRDKMGHHHFSGQGFAQQEDPRGHGFGEASHDRHLNMIDVISDCQVLLARGMGRGAQHSMEQAGIRPVLTDIAGIEEAVQAYLAGSLEERPELAH
ncbi:MAG: dinitrogenase iron-molybdenum cofactor biosynthesis protein [Chloroflexia bacterium]|nr:dinitrogenase iron-molybdenum cofactor biosynthesis protein [Chloroflexia bacterium]